MLSKPTSGRRDFLKATAGATAGIAVAGITTKASAAAQAWVDGMQVNENIDNLRVVSCRDPEMVNQDAPMVDFYNSQHAAANTIPVQANMDEMAKALAQESSAAAAWARIFRKPSAKSWADVRVAIKVNDLDKNIPRVAVLDKLCRVLNGLGVSSPNIVIYDTCGGWSIQREYGPFVGASGDPSLPAGVRIGGRNGDQLGGLVSASVPGISGLEVPADIGNGAIDIIINCTVNKGHGDWIGGLTLTMKNHLGTFVPPTLLHSVPNIISASKSNELLGGNPPRQQLCFIDSLWAMHGGPQGSPGDFLADGEHPNNYRLIMGTLSPAVDWLTAWKVRAPEVGRAPVASRTDNYLTDFGYTTTERDNLLTLPAEQNNGRGWVEVTPASAVRTRRAAGSVRRYGLTFSLSRTGRQGPSVRFLLPEPVRAARITILDARGKTVRAIESGRMPSVAWNGGTSDGGSAGAGTYVVKLTQGSYIEAKPLVVRH